MADGITIEIRQEGLQRKFETLAEKASDLNKPLRQMGAHLRRKALARYLAQDFPPLKASTLEKRGQAGLRTLENKLRGDVGRAMRRARGKALRSPRGALAAALDLIGVRTSALETTGVKNRLAVLAEFQRRHGREGSLQERKDLKALTLKQMVSLGARTDRAIGRQLNKRILGGLDRTLKIGIGNATVALVSVTGGKWSDVHNKGGAAGHGAAEPQRETIKLDNEDLDVFGEILKEHHILALTEG